MNNLIRPLLTAVLVSSQAALLAADSGKPTEIRLDYATYNPSSIVLKKQGWLEDDLKSEGIAVHWLLSAGSNKAVEALAAGTADFGSTAGSAALLARANEVALKTIYVFSRPEWAQLLVQSNSPLQKVADLKGKKIAATPGTDPFTLTLRALREAEVLPSEVVMVGLQHAAGYQALQRGSVDAWAALDPLLAKALLVDGARPLYHNIAFNSFGVLNVREAFLKDYPAYVQRVIRNYEKARLWVIAHSDETAALLAEAAKIDLAVAKNQLTQRTGLKPEDGVGIPGPLLMEALQGVLPVLVEERIAQPGSDPAAALKELIDPAPATAAIAGK
jgi:sulfonate transport system substrate-binding protein